LFRANEHSCQADRHFFEKFRQTEPSITRRHQGNGLGLTLAKELAEGMGGTIGWLSAPGVGSTFYIEMPATGKEEST